MSSKKCWACGSNKKADICIDRDLRKIVVLLNDILGKAYKESKARPKFKLILNDDK